MLVDIAHHFALLNSAEIDELGPQTHSKLGRRRIIMDRSSRLFRGTILSTANRYVQNISLVDVRPVGVVEADILHHFHLPTKPSMLDVASMLPVEGDYHFVGAIEGRNLKHSVLWMIDAKLFRTAHDPGAEC